LVALARSRIKKTFGCGNDSELNLGVPYPKIRNDNSGGHATLGVVLGGWGRQLNPTWTMGKGNQEDEGK